MPFSTSFFFELHTPLKMKSIKWGVRITRALVGLSVIRKTIPVIFLSWPSQLFSFLLHHFELLLCCFSAVFHTDSAQLLFLCEDAVFRAKYFSRPSI